MKKYFLGVKNVTQVPLHIISSCGFKPKIQIQAHFSKFLLFGGSKKKVEKLSKKDQFFAAPFLNCLWSKFNLRQSFVIFLVDPDPVGPFLSYFFPISDFQFFLGGLKKKLKNWLKGPIS